MLGAQPLVTNQYLKYGGITAQTGSDKLNVGSEKLTLYSPLSRSRELKPITDAPNFRLPSCKSFATQKMKPPNIKNFMQEGESLPEISSSSTTDRSGFRGGGGTLGSVSPPPPPPPPVALLTLLTFDPLSSLHPPPHCGAVASSKLQLKMFPLDEQSQNKAFPGCLPCTIWRSTSLLDWTDALSSLHSVAGVCLQHSC